MTRKLPVLLALVLCAAPLTASDLTGKWSGAPFYMIFEQHGEKISGTGGPSEQSQFPIENPVLDGDHLTFQVGPYPFDLHIIGDELRGEVRNGEKINSVYLKRVKPEDSGRRATLAFDAASVKPLPPGEDGRSTMRMNTGRLTVANVTLQALVTRAYDLKDYQVSAPDWMASAAFNINATLPPDSTIGDVQAMLQNLLKERFRMELHKEKREMPVYELIAGKSGLKLKEVPWGSGNSSGSYGKFTAKSIDLSQLAVYLTMQLDRPVIDKTGLKGHYDIELAWTPEGSRPKASGDGAEAAEPLGPSIYDAVQEQLGLKLQPSRVPVEMLIVDRAEKLPLGN